MPRYKKRADKRTTVAIRDDLHDDLRSEAFVRRMSIKELLDEIVTAHYDAFRGEAEETKDDI